MRHLDQMQAFSRIVEIRFCYRGASRLVGLDENMATCGWMRRMSKPKVEHEKTVPVMVMFCMQVKLDESSDLLFFHLIRNARLRDVQHLPQNCDGCAAAF